MILDLLMAAAGAQGSVTPEITFVAGANNAHSNNTSITVSIPSGSQAGDIAILTASSASLGDRSWSQSAGWTELAETSASLNSCVAYKMLDGSEANVTATCSSSGYITGVVVVYRAANWSNIGAYSATNATSITAQSITAALAGKLVAIFSCEIGAITSSSPSDMTLDYTTTLAVSYPQIKVYSQDILSGATPDKNFSISGSARYLSGVQVSLTPAI